jgi:hypothetical protein
MAREIGTCFSKVVALETVAYHRKLNAGRRRALVTGKLVSW